MKRLHVFLLLLSGALCISACTSGRESFSTEPGRGFGWKDMTKTQQHIQDSVREENSTFDMKSAFQGKSQPLVLPASEHVTIQTTPLSLDIDASIDVMRSPDQYMKVWFAPYQDEAGHLHESCVVHTIVKQGAWVIPNDALQEG